MIHLVYVDDDSLICEDFLELFASDSVKITCFNNPIKALNRLKDMEFDLLFIDYLMPKIKGDEFAKQLKFQGPTYLVTGEDPPLVDYPFNKIIKRPYSQKEIQEIIFEKQKFNQNLKKQSY